MQEAKKTKAQLLQDLKTLHQQLADLTSARGVQQETAALLRQREAQFQQLLEQSIQGISVMRFDGMRVFANPALARMLGYDHPAEVIGRPFLHQVAPADRDKVQACLEACARGDMGSARAEFQALKKDGSCAWFDHTSTLIVWEGDTAVLGTFLDITEQKHAEAALRASEARYRELFENASDMVYTVDLAGNFTAVNRAVETVTGYYRHELLTMNIADVIAPEFLERSHQMQARKHAGVVETTYDLEIITKKQQRAMVEVKSRFIFQDNLPIGVQGIARDVTERKRLERDVLTISEQERQRIGQELHDGLGQYLTGIALLSKSVEQQLMAQAHPASASTARIVDLISQAIAHMRHLTAGLWPVDLESRGLVAALQNLAGMVENLFEVSCQVVSTPLPEFPPPAVALHLYRIVQEAVHNAVWHGHAQQIGIRLTMAPEALTVTIQDNGQGLLVGPESEQGLGLRLMTYRADLIGARLTIQPTAGGGTLVTCIVPTLSMPRYAARDTGTKS